MRNEEQSPGNTRGVAHPGVPKAPQPCALVWIRAGIAALCWAVVASTPASGAAPDASSTTPFRFVLTPDGRFTASDLTRRYERDCILLLAPAPSLLDPDELDRHGWFPYGDVADRPDSRRLLSEAEPQDVADLTDEQKDEIEGPSAGAYVGIPSAVAATGALIGGLGLLAKVLSEFFAP